MRVCFDLQSAVGRRTGVGNYTAHLAAALSRMEGEAEALTFFYFDFKRKGHGVPLGRCDERPVRWFPGRVAQGLWKYGAGPAYDAFAGCHDVYHFPNFIIPPLRRGAAVVTVHDLAFLRMPETIESRNLRYLRGRFTDTVDRAHAVIAVSRFTADELCALTPVDAARVHVVHEGLCEVADVPPDAREAVRERFGVNRPFLLTVGTVEPRKNYPFLLDLYDALDADVDLVIAGGAGWQYEPIFERARSSRKAGRIHMTGWLNARDLSCLYACAELFVYPTRYEGFGFPPLEAMQHGLPVVASDLPVLREVLGEAAEWAPPGDLEGWRHLLKALIEDHARRSELVQAGRKQVGRYTWERAARETYEVYRKVVGA